MGRKTNIASVVGGYVGYKAGHAITGLFLANNTKSKMPSILHNRFGPRIAVETMEAWQKSGEKPGFDFASEAQSLDDKHLYQAVYNAYGEQAADFLEGRIDKARNKKIEVDYDDEMREFLQGRGIECDNANPVRSIVDRYRYDEDFIRIYQRLYTRSGLAEKSSVENFISYLAVLPALILIAFAFQAFPDLFSGKSNSIAGLMYFLVLVSYCVVAVAGLGGEKYIVGKLGRFARVFPVVLYTTLLAVCVVSVVKGGIAGWVLPCVVGVLAVPGSKICMKAEVDRY